MLAAVPAPGGAGAALADEEAEARVGDHVGPRQRRPPWAEADHVLGPVRREAAVAVVEAERRRTASAPLGRRGPEARGGGAPRTRRARALPGDEVEPLGAPVRPGAVGDPPLGREPVEDRSGDLLVQLALVLAQAEAREQRALRVGGARERGIDRGG